MTEKRGRKKGNPKETLNVKMEPDLHEWLKVHCAKRKKTMSSIVVNLLESYRKKMERV